MRRLPRFHVYLLLSEHGEVYAGFTGNLRRRLREHNAKDNTGWTRGRRWHLLAVRCFLDRHSAMLVERQLKQSRYDKDNWLRRRGPTRRRLQSLCALHRIAHRYARV